MKKVFLAFNPSDMLVKKERLEESKMDESNKVSMKSEAASRISLDSDGTDFCVKEEILDTNDVDDETESKTTNDNIADEVIGASNNLESLESLPEKSSINEELKKRPVSSPPLLSLPEFLTDQTTSGTLDQQLSAQFAIISLDFPSGTKALLHCDRLWWADQAMSVWDRVTDKVVRVSARRVEGFEEFDYQVLFCHLNIVNV